MFFYYLVIALALLAAAPFLLWREKTRAGLWQKLGVIPEAIKEQAIKNRSKNPIWFNAVSVGEFNAAWPLIDALHKKHPQIPIYLSTTTKTGQEQAQSKAGSFATIFYCPYDLPQAASNWLDSIKPSLVILVETEIWPGFTYQCAKRGISLMWVNARMSPRSFKRYHLFKGLFGPVFRRFKQIAAQSEAEVERFKRVAGDELAVTATGNLKFDGLKPIEKSEREKLEKSLAITAGQAVIVAGSTHEGEEQAVLSAYREVLEKQSATNLQPRLIIAPRHPERFARAKEIIEENGFVCRRFSQNEGFSGENEVYLLDTIGKLGAYYSLATIAFVGGTLVPIGGHNLMEPYVYGAPVICGPQLFKTKDVAKTLNDRGALFVIQDEKELAVALTLLLSDDGKRQSAGLAGQTCLTESQGAVARTLNLIEKMLIKDIASANYNDERAASGKEDR